MTDGRRQVETFRLGGDLAVTGFHFPVAGPHDFSDVAPRSGGRLHERTDIFGLRGHAAAGRRAGALADVGTNSLGGSSSGWSGERYALLLRPPQRMRARRG